MKYILFDADGVLIHSEMFSIQYQKEFGIEKEKMLPFFSGIFRDCLIGKADLKKEISVYLLGWGWKKSVDEFLKYWFESENKVDQRIVDKIGKLRKKGYKCYLATNQEKYRVEFMKKQMNFEMIFDGIFASSMIESKKHSPEFYDFVVSNLRTTSDEILFIDDEIQNIEVAKNKGIQTYLFQNFDDFEKIIDNY